MVNYQIVEPMTTASLIHKWRAGEASRNEETSIPDPRWRKKVYMESFVIYVSNKSSPVCNADIVARVKFALAVAITSRNSAVMTSEHFVVDTKTPHIL